MHPGTLFDRRQAVKTARHDWQRSQAVLPHGQERVVIDHDSTEAPAGLAPPDERCYRDTDGLITMCVACHRMQHPDTEEWVRVPQWETSPPDEVTGGLCVSCFQEHYAKYLPQSDSAVA